MMSDKDMAVRAGTILDLLYEKFGLRAQDLQRATRRAGRRLPRGVRRRIARLHTAQMHAGNPRLARQIDTSVVDADYAAVVAHLRGIDVADRRRGQILGVAAAVAGNLLAVVAMFIVWLWSRGYV